MMIDRYLVKAYDYQVERIREVEVYEDLMQAYLEYRGFTHFKLKIGFEKSKSVITYYHETEDGVWERIGLGKSSFEKAGLESIEHKRNLLQAIRNELKEDIKLIGYIDDYKLYDEYINDAYESDVQKFIRNTEEHDIDLPWVKKLYPIIEKGLIIPPLVVKSLVKELGTSQMLRKKREELYERVLYNVMQGYYKGVDYESFCLIDPKTDVGYFVLSWATKRMDTGQLGRLLQVWKKLQDRNVSEYLELLNKAERRFSYRVVEGGKSRRATLPEVAELYDNCYMEKTYPEITEKDTKIIYLAAWLLCGYKQLYYKIEQSLPDSDMLRHFDSLLIELESAPWELWFGLSEREEEKLDQLEKEGLHAIGNPLQYYLDEVYQSREYYKNNKSIIWDIYQRVVKEQYKNKNKRYYTITPKQLNYFRDAVRKVKNMEIPNEAFLDPSSCPHSSFRVQQKEVEDSAVLFNKPLMDLDNVKDIIEKAKLVLKYQNNFLGKHDFGAKVSLSVVKYNRCSEKQQKYVEESFEKIRSSMRSDENSLEKELTSHLKLNDIFSEDVEKENNLLEKTSIFD